MSWFSTPKFGRAPSEQLEANHDGVRVEFNDRKFADLIRKGLKPHYMHGYRYVRVANERVFELAARNCILKAIPAVSHRVQPQESAVERLNNLIGMTEVKKQLQEAIAYVKVANEKRKRGLLAPEAPLHLVFSGNPGTGKTEAARILARALSEIGFLAKGQLIEVDRSKLVAGYIGHTATKTLAACEAALDGILFIDEAYSLAGKGSEDFGKESIETLLKFMEDNRERIVVIVAGYETEIEQFMSSNPGLRSRFSRTIRFPDYTVEELARIFVYQLQERQLSCQSDTLKAVDKLLQQLERKPMQDYANARGVRKLVERCVNAQHIRLDKSGPLDKLNNEEFSRICKADVPSYTDLR